MLYSTTIIDLSTLLPNICEYVAFFLFSVSSNVHFFRDLQIPTMVQKGKKCTLMYGKSFQRLLANLKSTLLSNITCEHVAFFLFSMSSSHFHQVSVVAKTKPNR